MLSAFFIVSTALVSTPSAARIATLRLFAVSLTLFAMLSAADASSVSCAWIPA